MHAVKEQLRRAIQHFDSATSRVSGRFIPLDRDKVEHLREFFRQRWVSSAIQVSEAHAASVSAYWNSDVGRRDLEGHVVSRLEHDRHEYIPWLNHLRPLNGARVLEIGCGTGSSVMALAEQGARVTGIDVVDEAIDMTKERMRVFGLEHAGVLAMNAVDLRSRFRKGGFDVIIFSASLEHMTIPERLESLRAAWSLLEADGLLCVIEAPNRLWYYDDHTSDLPFFHWLPDQIAIEYWRHSMRGNDLINDSLPAEEKWLAFARLGRGVSFHEFELALGPIGGLSVQIDRASFQSAQNPMRRLQHALSTKRTYSRILRRQCLSVPAGFFMPYLNIAIRKSDSPPVAERQ